MKHGWIYHFIASALAAALGCGNAAAQSTSESAATWQFALTPYLWFPVVNGSVQFTLPSGVGGGSASVEKGADDYLSNLDMAAMLTFEARTGAWAIFSDLMYLDFSEESGSVKTLTGPGGLVQVPVNAGTQLGLEGGVWQLAASYNFSSAQSSPFEILGGFRYLKLETTVDWQLTGPIGLFPQSGTLTETAELWDAIVGVRGKAKLGEGNWFVPYYLDVGAGDSELTWQGLAGIGYSFKWGDVLLTYRHLFYEQKAGKPVHELEMSGPALGATFHF